MSSASVSGDNHKSEIGELSHWPILSRFAVPPEHQFETDALPEVGIVIPLPDPETNTVHVVYSVFFEDEHVLRYANTRPDDRNIGNVGNTTDILTVDSSNGVELEQEGFDAAIGPDGTIHAVAQVNEERAESIDLVSGTPQDGFSRRRLEDGFVTRSPREAHSYVSPAISVDTSGNPFVAYIERREVDTDGDGRIEVASDFVHSWHEGSRTEIEEYPDDGRPVEDTVDVEITGPARASVAWWKRERGDSALRYADPLSDIGPVNVPAGEETRSRKVHVGTSPRGDHLLLGGRGGIDDDFVAVRDPNEDAPPTVAVETGELSVDRLEAVIGNENGDVFAVGFNNGQGEHRPRWESLVGRRNGEDGEWSWHTSSLFFASNGRPTLGQLGQTHISRGRRGQLHLSGNGGSITSLEPNLGSQDDWVEFSAGPNCWANVTNGNLVSAFSLFETNGLGPGLSTSLVYNSQDDRRYAGFGSAGGWKLNHQIRLQFNPWQFGKKNMVLVLPDGDRVLLYADEPVIDSDGAPTGEHLQSYVPGTEPPAGGVVFSPQEVKVEVNGSEWPDLLYTAHFPDGTKYQFDSAGRVTEVMNARGHSLDLTYEDDRPDFLSSVTDENGRTVEFRYDDDRLTRVLPPTGTEDHAVDVNFNSDDELVSLRLPEGVTWRFEYHDETGGGDGAPPTKANFLSAVSDPHGNTWEYQFRPDRRLQEVQDPNDDHPPSTITYVDDGHGLDAVDVTQRWDEPVERAVFTNRCGDPTTIDYFRRSSVATRTIDPPVEDLTGEYNGEGTRPEADREIDVPTWNTERLTDRRANTTVYEYKENTGYIFGLRKARKPPATDERGRPEHLTRYTFFDGEGNAIKGDEASVSEIEFRPERDAPGSQSEAEEANLSFVRELATVGPVTTRAEIGDDGSIDRGNSVSTIRTGKLHVYADRSDGAGRVGQLTSTYDIEVDPAGSQITGRTRSHERELDEQGRPTEITDADGNTTERRYEDPQTGLVTGEKAPGREFSTVSYDGMGNRTEYTDPTDGTTTVERDDLFRETTTTLPEAEDGSRPTREREFDGIRVVSETNPEGTTTRYDHNVNGWVTGIEAPEGSGQRTDFERNEEGFVSAETGPPVRTGSTTRPTTTHTLNSRNERVRTEPPESAPVERTLYADGTVAETRQAASRAEFSRDARKNLTEVVTRVTRPAIPGRGIETGGSDTQKIVDELRYDPADRLTASSRKADDEFVAGTSFVYASKGPVFQRIEETADPPQNPSETTTARRFTTDFGYDPSLNLTTIVDPSGRETRYTYTSDSLPKEIIDGFETTIRQTDYDDDQRPTEVRAPTANEQRASASEGGQGDGSGLTTMQTVEYNQIGWPTSIADPHQVPVQNQYNQIGQVTQFVDRNGNPVDATRDDSHRITEMREPLDDSRDRRSQFEYDKAGNPTARIDPEGNRYEFLYNQEARLAEITTPENTTEQFSYGDRGNLTRHTDPRGIVHRYTYDERDRRTEEHHGENGSTIKRRHGSDDQLESIVEFREADGESEGRYEQYLRIDREYNDRRLVERIEWYDDADEGAEPFARITDIQYDDAGHRTSLVDPEGNRISYEYDENGRVSTVTRGSADGEKSETVAVYTYNADGTVGSILVGGDETEFVYRKEFIYNDRKRPVEVRVTNRDDRVLAHTTYEYDHVGNVVNKTLNHLNREISYVYNDADQLVAENWASSATDGGDTVSGIEELTLPTPSFGYQYDRNGNRTEKTVGGLPQSSAQSMLSESIGTRPFLSVSQGNSFAAPVSGQHQYTYDDENRIQRETVRTEANVAIGVDSIEVDSEAERRSIRGGRFEEESGSGGGSLTNLLSGILNFFAQLIQGILGFFGLRGSESEAEGRAFSKQNVIDRDTADAFDPEHAWCSTTAQTPHTATLRFDTEETVTHVQAFFPTEAGLPQQFRVQYEDERGNWSELPVTGGSGVEEVEEGAFRATGRDVTLDTDPVGATAIRYRQPAGGGPADDENRACLNELTAFTQREEAGTARTFEHDVAGNLIEVQNHREEFTRRFEYDPQNRQQGFEQFAGLDPGDGTTPQMTFGYSYAPTGQRVRKENRATGESTLFVHDGDDVIADYTQEDGESFQLNKTYVNGPDVDSKLAAYPSDGESSFYLRDRLNSTSAIVSPDGSVENHYATNAWGENIDRVEETENRYTFTGREENRESDTMHYRARAYFPAIGRFMQRDPNSPYRENFQYASNNPVSAVDPLGLQSHRLVGDAREPSEGETPWKRQDAIQRVLISPPVWTVIQKAVVDLPAHVLQKGGFSTYYWNGIEKNEYLNIMFKNMMGENVTDETKILSGLWGEGVDDLRVKHIKRFLRTGSETAENVRQSRLVDILDDAGGVLRPKFAKTAGEVLSKGAYGVGIASGGIRYATAENATERWDAYLLTTASATEAIPGAQWYAFSFQLGYESGVLLRKVNINEQMTIGDLSAASGRSAVNLAGKHGGGVTGYLIAVGDYWGLINANERSKTGSIDRFLNDFENGGWAYAFKLQKQFLKTHPVYFFNLKWRPAYEEIQQRLRELDRAIDRRK